MFNFFKSESKTIIGAATLIGVFSFVSRVFGFIRDRVLAGSFGAGDTLDAYYAAFKIPDLLFGLIVVGALSASFIPLFSKKYLGLRHEDAWRFTNNVLHLMLLTMALISMIAFVFAGPLSSMIAPGFSEQKRETVALFMRVMLFAQILLGASMVFGSVLQGIKRFVLYAMAPVLYNIGIIIGAVFFVDLMGPIGLAWGVVLGAVFHVGIQMFGCYQAGWRYALVSEPNTKEIHTMIRLTGPRVLSIAVNQLLFIIFTILSTTMAVGSVTMFHFAYNIQFFPIGIFGVSLAIAAFPTFTHSLDRNDIDGFRHAFSSTVRQAMFFLIPIAIAFLLLRAQIVRVVVGAGAFDWASTITTADTLAFFAITFVPQSLVYIFARAFFALHDTVTPLTAGLVGALVGLISAFLFKDQFGVVGLGMAFSIYAIVNLILLWVPLRQRVGSLDEARIWQSLMKLIVAGMACAIVIQLLKIPLAIIFPLGTFFGVLFQGGVAGIFGLVAYALCAWFLKSLELTDFTSAMHRKILKRSEPTETIAE